jgi:hypothetical protein
MSNSQKEEKILNYSNAMVSKLKEVLEDKYEETKELHGPLIKNWSEGMYLANFADNEIEKEIGKVIIENSLSSVRCLKNAVSARFSNEILEVLIKELRKLAVELLIPILVK